MLKLPQGAEAKFRLVNTDAWGAKFTIHLHGAGRKGWYVLSRRSPGKNDDLGPIPLLKGQWRIFLNLIKQARFWDLPAKWPNPPPDVTVDDGDSLDITGRTAERFHQIHRFIWREQGLDQLLDFCLKISKFDDPFTAEIKPLETMTSKSPEIEGQNPPDSTN